MQHPRPTQLKRKFSIRPALLLAALLMIATAALAQRFGAGRNEGPKREFASKAEFHFIRMEYTDLPEHRRRFGYSSRGGSGEGWWMMDWPDAEEHFTMGVNRLTRVDAGEPRHFRLTDPKLFEHPWMYATQVGWWDLSDEEIANLREYLLRGGFLVVDDFYGPEQWETFRRTMERALPDRPIVDILDSDPAMHVLYSIEEKDRVFIPGTRHLRRGPGGSITVQPPPGTEPAWRAIYDDKGRMLVAINFNMDVADAWEYADWPEYPEAMTTLAYRFGINYLVYSMTH